MVVLPCQVVSGLDTFYLVFRVLFSSTGVNLAHPTSEFQSLGMKNGEGEVPSAHSPLTRT